MLPRLFASFMCFSHDFLFVLTDSARYLQYRPYLIECWPFSKPVSRATNEGMRGFSEKQYLFLDRVGCRLAERAGVEPTQARLTSPTDFEDRPPHRGTISSVACFI